MSSMRRGKSPCEPFWHEYGVGDWTRSSHRLEHCGGLMCWLEGEFVGMGEHEILCLEPHFPTLGLSQHHGESTFYQVRYA